MRASAFLLAALVLGAPAVAAGHAQLVQASPARRAVLGRAPAQVELTFSERLEPAYSTLSVWSETGARVDRGDGKLSPDDPRRLAVSLPALPPGTYTVRYRVLSVDGHVAEAAYAFTVSQGR